VSRAFSTYTDSLYNSHAADYDSLAVPANAATVMIIGKHQDLLFYGGPAKNPITANDWALIPKDLPTILPVADMNYIRYKPASNACRIYLIWFLM